MELDVRKYASGNIKAGVRIRRDIKFMRNYMKDFVEMSFKYDLKMRKIKELRRMVKIHGKEKVRDVFEEVKKEEEIKKEHS